MSNYDKLSDEGKIKLARDAVKCGVPIAPALTTWLQVNSLYDRVTNPRRTNASTEATSG